MVELKTLFLKFKNCELYFVGQKDDMWHIEEYFYRCKNNKRQCTAQKYIEMAIKYNIHMGSASDKILDKILTDFLMVKRKLKPYDLYINFGLYMEAMCFEESGRRHLKNLLELTDEDIAEIVEKSEWNTAYN